MLFEDSTTAPHSKISPVFSASIFGDTRTYVPPGYTTLYRYCSEGISKHETEDEQLEDPTEEQSVESSTENASSYLPSYIFKISLGFYINSLTF